MAMRCPECGGPHAAKDNAACQEAWLERRRRPREAIAEAAEVLREPVAHRIVEAEPKKPSRPAAVVKQAVVLQPSAPVVIKRGGKARLLAPPGQCAYCDARREHSRLAMQRYRGKGTDAPDAG